MFSGRGTDRSLVTATPTEYVCLTEYDRKDPCPIGAVVNLMCG